MKRSTALSNPTSGIGASRKVDMKDGKNWFQEKVTVFQPHQALEFELTACSFPVHKLKHTYSFEPSGLQTKVKQVMQYQVKFGLLGKVMDKLVMRKKQMRALNNSSPGSSHT